MLPMKVWNEKFGRWVKRDSKGIAVFDKDSPKLRLKYYYDVSDTQEGRYRRLLRPVPLWEVPEEYQPDVRETLANAFGVDETVTGFEAVSYTHLSNLQREKVLPSEKAFAYKMKLDAMKRQQGFRSDLTSATLLQRSEKKSSRQLLAEEVGESHEQIRKYIRLTELITPILDMVDEGKIAMRPAVELSYLPKEQQQALFDTMELEDCTPSHAQAIKMRKFAEAGKLNEDVILSIMTEEKPNQVEQFKIPKKRIDKYFSPGTTPKQMEDTIIKALELYLSLIHI